MSPLPPAPDALVDATGRPRFGAYEGSVRDGCFDRLAAPFARAGLRRMASEKRWHYACVLSPSLIVGAAIVRLGYLANTFLFVFDRRERRMLFDRTWVLAPKLVRVEAGPGGIRAEARMLRGRALIESTPHAGRLSASLGSLELDLALDTGTAPNALTAICPVGEDAATLTRKTTCVPARGEVRVGAATYRLGGAFACLDFSQGFLLRETRWRWASACGPLADGRMLGLNLVEGHNDGPVTENALWIDGRLVPVGRARFEFDPRDPMRRWAVRSDDGRVDLLFAPEGLRRQDLDLKLVASEYVQPVGAWSGTVRTEAGEELAVRGLPGVAENHRSVW